MGKQVDGQTFVERARDLIIDYTGTLEEENIKVVWFCKTLQNWKAMVADLGHDGMFFEVTYNGDKEVTYIDAYRKYENVVIPDGN